MKFNLFITFLVVISLSKGNAQEFKLGKVSVKELEEKVHPIDSTASAAILFNKARTFFKYDSKFGFSIVTENTFRIKIYKKEGLNWANYKLPYRIGYEELKDDRVEFSDCVTYNLENGTVVATKLKSEGIFKTAVNQFWKETSITLPNVKSGSIIEFKYILVSENIIEFPDFIFQYTIPVNSSEYHVDIPGFFVYKAVAKRAFEIKSESKISRGSLQFSNQHNLTTTESVSFEQQSNTYKANNIRALKEEPFVDNIENYRISIQHELEKTQFYQEPVKDYAQTWEGVAKTIYKDKDFGAELNERQYMVEDLEKIIHNEASETEKMEVIFKFVQNKMNWNGKRGYYVDKGVQQAYINGTGNTAEINFILMAMLNRSGIKAEPVLLSTIDHGIPLYPNRSVFNYVVAAVTIDGKRILLDATNKKAVSNILPLYTQNWVGRLIRQDGTSEEIALHPTFLSRKTVNMIASIDSKGILSGKYRVNYSDYEAFTFREKYSGINKQNYLDKVENDVSGMQITDYSIENDQDLSKPIIENFTFKADNQSEIIGDKIYLEPLLFFTPTRNPFVQENRDFPIYFGYPTQLKCSFSISIPDGYAVESFPKSINLATVENVGSFVFNISVANNVIQISSAIELKRVVISTDFYQNLKGFYKQMNDKLNEKIVLKKF